MLSNKYCIVISPIIDSYLEALGLTKEYDEDCNKLEFRGIVSHLECNFRVAIYKDEVHNTLVGRIIHINNIPFRQAHCFEINLNYIGYGDIERTMIGTMNDILK